MKTVPDIRDVNALITNVANPDIRETLQAEGDIEDAIFQQFDRLQVLLAMQSQLDNSESPVVLPNRGHFSQLLEEQMTTLRRLVDKHFS